MLRPIAERLAVCSWSLQPNRPADLIRDLRAIGISQVQLALDPIRAAPETWGDAAAELEAAGIRIVSGMFGTIGEDYSSLESIRRTGGVVPDEHWPANWSNIKTTAGMAARMGVRALTFHAGFLPHDESDPAFNRLRDRIRQIADVMGEHGVELCCETGQETADTLCAFLEGLDRRNVGVNFDPANMILYDKGNPIEALERLGPWVRSCHIKDAIRTRVAGTWGEEVVVGTGQVDWRAFFATLRAMKFEGPLAVEREAGNQRVKDIQAAHHYIREWVAAS